MLGTCSALVIVLACPSIRIVLLLATSVWSFARLYYYAFYVLERYIDPEFRYAGLFSLAHYLLKNRSRGRRDLN